AKSQLSNTIRGLRERLLRDLRATAEQDYRLSVRAQDAGLSEAARIRRKRLEDWLDERARSASPKNDNARTEARERFLSQAVKDAAATLLNRLVLLRHMEAVGMVAPPVVTGGWNSKGYREFREFAPALLGDETEGYAYLLKVVCDELALDLPGLFGDVGLSHLFRVPASTLREVVEQLDDKELESAWTDDTTLGWVYQYWNDPEREALDAKINGGGKVEPHEIASKTQMFTERYMVEWLLHNSLGLTWLCMCKKHGWTADATSPPGPLSMNGEGESEAESVLEALDRRRAMWREKRERGEVALDALMPVSEGLEDRWKYYVPQPIPDDAVASAPESIRDLKLLDPACGSGHFLIIAFDLLAELHREEARHRGETWSDQEIAESILERNLYGVDIDPRAIQIAAAGLYLKSKRLSRGARIKQLNLVAPALNLATLPDDDPALVRLVREMREETGIPEELTRKLVKALSGVDHLGTLLKVDAAVDEAIREYESKYGKGSQLDINLTPQPPLHEWRGGDRNGEKLPVTGGARVLPEKAELARVFRKDPTQAEKRAWELLRDRRLLGLKFRRQQVIQGFIADFYCAEHHLVIELDGPVHVHQREYDTARTLLFQSLGLTEVRVGNEEVSERVLAERVLAAIETSPPGPLSINGEGESSASSSPPSPFMERGAGGGEVSTKATLLAKLEQFLAHHEGEEDLGLRLDGEQLAAGVRFVRIVKEDTYDIVVGNPPYQGTSKMADAKYVAKHYPRGKADLYAAFLERGLELARSGGMSALLTMRGWMFINQYRGLREWLLSDFDLRNIGDFAVGAFDEVPNDVLSVAISTFRKTPPTRAASVATQPSPPDDKSYDRQRTNRKRAAVLAQVGRYEFDPRGFEVIEGEPIVYWWGEELLKEYGSAPVIGDVTPGRAAQSTGDNVRFVRCCWEIGYSNLRSSVETRVTRERWGAFVNGSEGLQWLEPFREVVNWGANGLPIKSSKCHKTGVETCSLASENHFFRLGIAFSMIGANFAARAYRFPSVFGNKGSSVFPADIPQTLCSMNSSRSRMILQSLNPGIGFEVGDVNRLPLFPIESADEIYTTIEAAFTEHEAARESSVEFKRPGRSAWRYAQDWAQRAVDRLAGAPLPAYAPEYDPPKPESFLSFALGVALGRFGAEGEGILETSPPSPLSMNGEGGSGKGPGSSPPSPFTERGAGGGEVSSGTRGICSLPTGILFLSDATERDSLDHPACEMLKAMWAEHGATISPKDDLRSYLRKGYFDCHKDVYENRPITFPLSSEKKTFVAYASIHCWQSDTLQTLLAEHLYPERRRLEGELEDLRKARAENRVTGKTEKRFDQVKKVMDELEAFIAAVTELAEHGPPPTDAKCPPREVDARFEMDLDDGVMVNSAALWPLLEPQWKKPKGWWKELATAQGKKDYDWAHLAMRYFPSRVDAKCKQDPSLGVAHGCFWKYHPAKTYQWELRLKDEIRPDFTIDEVGSDEYRAMFVEDHPELVQEILAKEMKRRERKAAKAGAEDDDNLSLPFDQDGEQSEETDE
ncbi:MAG: BREX-6 system adenine-specific DNA-methyltransferase PglX, partial [Myxococcota bacterium]|nr:BREX-6 system adenine-specific DNA-methyltransferase PglX [Myxococcota bacterium]